MSRAPLLAPIVKRFARNATTVVVGSLVAALLGFGTLALNARALGAELLGVLTLLQAYAGVTSKLFSFETWQPMIALGAQAQKEANMGRLRDLLVIGFGVDVVGALLSFVASLSIAFMFLPAFGISEEWMPFVLVFSLTTLANVSGAAVGYIRLENKFAIISFIQVAASITMFILSLIFTIVGASFGAYVYGFATVAAMQSIAPLMAAILLWRRRQNLPFTWSSLGKVAESREFWRLSWATSGVGTINVLRQNADSFVLAAIIGPTATGTYRVAVQIASIISRLGDPLQQAFFPEVAHLAAEKQGQNVWRMLRRISMVGAVVLAIVLLCVAQVADDIVEIVAGEAFRDAGASLVWLTLAHGLGVAGFYIRPTIISFVGTAHLLIVYLGAFCVFVPALWLAITAFGVSGAGISQLAFVSVWYALGTWVIYRRLRS